MEHRLMQPASREQIVAIIRQRAERHREFAAAADGGVEVRGLGPPPPPFMAPGMNHPLLTIRFQVL